MRGRVQNPEGHVFAFRCPIPHHIFLYLHIIRGVFADAPQSFLKHDEYSSAHSDHSDFSSRFPS